MISYWIAEGFKKGKNKIKLQENIWRCESNAKDMIYIEYNS
jgi:hypothetical protein